MSMSRSPSIGVARAPWWKMAGPGILVILALGYASCSDSGEASSVSAPSPPAPSQPSAGAGVSVLADATLSGIVYEVLTDSPRQIVGVEGASVYCEQCGESTHNFADTDSKGHYVFPRGVWTEGRPSFPIRIFVTKDGYQDPGGLPKPTPPNPSGPGWREVLIDGDTQFDMELVRR
jgi:hypothetical protein